MFPSVAANSVHVIKMCQALSENGNNVVLHAERVHGKPHISQKQIFEAYGVSGSFDMRLRTAGAVRGQRLLNAFLSAQDAAKNSQVAYARNTLAAYFCALLGKPLVLEIHQPPDTVAFARLVRRRELLQVVAITSALAKEVLRGFPHLEGKITVAPDGADAFPAEVRPVALPRQHLALQVGYVGNLYQGKGMEVVSGVAERCPWAEFTVVGGDTADVEHWRNLMDDRSNITFTGHVPHATIPNYLASFDVVLLPNQARVSSAGMAEIGRWTSPLKMFEYMAAGKAIISSDLPVLREILEQGRTAMLCRPDDIDAWVDTLVSLRDSPRLRRALGDAARREFEAHYSWQARAARVVSGL